MNILSERLLTLRQAAGLNQQEVADGVQIAVRTYAYYEKGTREPLASVLARFADFYHVSADYLLGRTDKP